MKTVKVFVGQGDHAGITCPYCEKNHQVSFAKLKGSKHNLVTKCTCQKQFKIELNFRQYYRKKTKLIGEFIPVSSNSNNWIKVTVINLSMIGLRFKVIGHTGIEKGDQLRVKFTLDNKKATDLEKEVRVINIENDLYGCEFSNKDYEKELGFYLRT